MEAVFDIRRVLYDIRDLLSDEDEEEEEKNALKRGRPKAGDAQTLTDLD